jgi:YD repeat-containing protein
LGQGTGDEDPEGAYTLAYDAARRALTAVLQNQGPRATSRGGHTAVYEAVRAQLDPPLGSILRPFTNMPRY